MSFLNVICLLNVLYILVKYHKNILTCFKVTVRTKFLQFWRQGEIIHGPSQLELSFLYLTPLPFFLLLYEISKSVTLTSRSYQGMGMVLSKTLDLYLPTCKIYMKFLKGS